MYLLNNHTPQKIESTTFKDLHLKESDIEEILRKNVDLVCDDDDESMLIVGQQVRNEQNGRSDLTAIDSEGDIVLIEIKRDKADIIGRKEAFEFQAIRYAASCATIKDTNELVQNVFAPYVEKHREEFIEGQELTSFEIAKRKLEEFLGDNNADTFNQRQRIILVASDYDEQTLSAVAWLNSNKVDISCYQICPYKLNDQVIIEMKKLLPIVEYEDYYVKVVQKDAISKTKSKDITRRALPKIDVMLEWTVVKEGDILTPKGRNEEAVLQKDGQVKTEAGVESIQQWLKRIYGWSSVQTYAFCVHKEQGKTLAEIRQEYMEKVII